MRPSRARHVYLSQGLLALLFGFRLGVLAVEDALDGALDGLGAGGDAAGDVANGLGLVARVGGEAGHFVDEGLAPPGRGVLEDVALELLVVGLALLGGHGDGVVEGVGELLGVPGVDDEGAGEGLGGAGELGEDHDAVTLALRGNVLVRDEVHAVAGRGDEADVRDGVQGRQLLEGDGLVEEVDRHKLNGAEAAVDAADELVDDGAEVLVLLDVLARWDRHLNEDDAADPLGVLREEDLEGVELLGHALDVIESVDTDDELDALKLALQGLDALLDDGLLEALDKLLGVDADGEGTDSDEAALKLDSEVTSIVVRVEADEVAVKEAGEKGLAHRQDTVDFRGGEGCVQEEANLDILLGVSHLLTQHLGQQHEVIVVDPDQIAVLDVLDDRLGEEAVDLLVRSPGALVKGNLAGVVVEEGPEDRVGEAVVVAVGEVVVDEDGVGAVFVLEALLHASDFCLGNLEARPAVPLEARGFGQTAEASDETAGRHGELIVAIFLALDGDGQAVRQQEETTGRSGVLLEESRHGVCVFVSDAAWFGGVEESSK
ncbi:hypothetical protein BN1708_005977 [Verticillium longisporum]|uniref:NAD-specific glutamate dehydrogenase n=1 Tax=Verticillium longisporum TaxID=100787 RepID=A0A0G4MFQ6_VERLO|nr:hypothetical protein BN1708_005977 [Verticillium longisporum]